MSVLHTAEPWRVEDDTTQIWGSCNPDDHSGRGMGYPVTACQITPSGQWAKGPYADEGEANAARIVACVNALAGIPTPELSTLLGEVRGVMALARNRLQSHAVDAIARGDRRSIEFSEWADHPNALLAKLPVQS